DIDPQRLCRGPRQRSAHHAAAVVSDQRGRVAVQAVVEGAEREAAEAVQIRSRHDRRLDSCRYARGQRLGAQQARAVALVIRMGLLGKTPWTPADTPGRASPDRRLPSRALEV